MAFSKLSRGVIAYNLLVILWGAWVRISGSGAGCGSHWPLCNGEVMPPSPTVHTLIELSHRITSGLSLVLTVALAFAARRTFTKGHRARFWSALGLVFILLEAAIGAGLVKFGLVAKDDSAMRAVVICLHLVNTLGLLASGVMTWHSGRNPQPPSPVLSGWLMLALGAVVVTSATGAITALGDTLFPVGVNEPAEHFLVRLRIVHPLIALTSAGIVIGVARVRHRRGLQVVVAMQVIVGGMNILLKAPGWMQIVHLLMANLVWIALVTVIAEGKYEGHPTRPVAQL